MSGLGLESTEVANPRNFEKLLTGIVSWGLPEQLEQIEESCFLQPDKLAIARSFLAELWQQDKIAQNPYQPPKGWRYLPVPEAVERFKNIFGSSLKSDHVLKLAKDAKPLPHSEGVPTWTKLTTLAKLFGVEGNPLENTPKGLVAYAGVANSFVPKVGEEYIKAHSNKLGFANRREGHLTASHIVLTSAGRTAWQWLESQSDDDFLIASYGAVTGATYAGDSQRRSRLRIVLAGDQFPQDCVMTGGTLAVQTNRLCKDEHLRIDNPGNAYSPDADGKFWGCVRWRFDAVDRQLEFDCGLADFARRSYGSATLLRS